MGKGENMKITGNQFNTNNFMQNNKKNIGFKPWNSKIIMSGQNIFRANIRQDKNEKLEGPQSSEGNMYKGIYESIILDKIARKIARGEEITAEERAMIMEKAPDRLEKAVQANKRRKEIENRVKAAKTEREARDIILESKVEAKIALDKGDQIYGEYLMEAVNKVESDYNKNGGKNKGNTPKDINEKEKGKGIDIRL